MLMSYQIHFFLSQKFFPSLTEVFYTISYFTELFLLYDDFFMGES